ncbi:hypothetical protein AWQ24_11820 [Picosynechococcus sp. PCC 8807]|nr:hypothetical protein AWQ24_11820 [Picosynechococcus sp. PCC 8807]
MSCSLLYVEMFRIPASYQRGVLSPQNVAIPLPKSSLEGGGRRPEGAILPLIGEPEGGTKQNSIDYY